MEESYSPPGSLITIKWASSGAPANSIASITLIDEAQNVGTPLTGSWFNNDSINLPLSAGSYTANIPSYIQPGKYKIRLECIDSVSSMSYCGQVGSGKTVQDYSDGSISVTATPTLNITFPTFGATLKKGSTYNITWTGSEPGVTSYDVHIVDGEGLGSSSFF